MIATRRQAAAHPAAVHKMTSVSSQESGTGRAADASAPDGWADTWGKALYRSLWRRAWGRRYPDDVRPFSSCTVQLLGQLVGELELAPGSTLADYGCGAGGVGLWLARALDAHVIGLDRSGPAVSIARSRAPDWVPAGRADFLAGDFAGSGLPAEHVDAVVSVDALPFAQDVDAALSEIHRVLRPEGRLVFTTRELSDEHPRWATVGPSWSFALERCGLRVRRVTVRPGLSALWRRVYDLWVENEAPLRAELSDHTVDGMMQEVRNVGPRLEEERAWLLVTAEKPA